MHTCCICIEPMSPSSSSNSTNNDSQKGVDPSLTWKAMFLPRYLHGVLKNYKIYVLDDLILFIQKMFNVNR